MEKNCAKFREGGRGSIADKNTLLVRDIWVLNLVSCTEGGTYAECDWEWGSEDEMWA
jgi:hypothetical protein